MQPWLHKGIKKKIEKSFLKGIKKMQNNNNNKRTSISNSDNEFNQSEDFVVNNNENEFIQSNSIKRKKSSIENFITDKKLEQQSKDNYMGKLNRIKIFLLSNNKNNLIDSNGQIIVPLDFETIISIFNWLASSHDLCSHKKLTIENVSSNSNTTNENEFLSIMNDSLNEQTISVQTMQGYKSALLFWYKESTKGGFDKETDDWIEEFIGGYEKIVQKKKEDGVMKIQEGRKHLTFSGYNWVTEAFYKMQNPTSDQAVTKGRGFDYNEWISSTLFLILCWNLMGRSHSIGSIHYSHIDLVDDCITITYARSKSDQKGKSQGATKHVYANPINPKLCPFLALAIYIFSFHKSANDDKLFFGDYSEDKFCKSLQKLLNNFEDINNHLGFYNNNNKFIFKIHIYYI